MDHTSYDVSDVSCEDINLLTWVIRPNTPFCNPPLKMPTLYKCALCILYVVSPLDSNARSRSFAKPFREIPVVLLFAF